MDTVLGNQSGSAFLDNPAVISEESARSKMDIIWRTRTTVSEAERSLSYWNTPVVEIAAFLCRISFPAHLSKLRRHGLIAHSRIGHFASSKSADSLHSWQPEMKATG